MSEVRRVSRRMTICYRGAVYDVSDIPGVEVGDGLEFSGREADCIEIHLDGPSPADYVLAPLQFDEYGFPKTAKLIGE